MCFSSGSSKPPPPQQPTKFEYLSPTDQRRVSVDEKGAAQPATFGSELAAGGTTPAAAPRTEGAM